MASFSDNKERVWELRLDAPLILQIREQCDPKFLLADDEEDNTYMRMRRDPVLLCRVMYLLTEKQRQERNVSEESFYMEVVGAAIKSATEALLEAITNFSHSPEDWKMLKALVDKDEEVRRLSRKMLQEKLEDKTLIDRVLKRTEQALNEQLTPH